MLPNAEIHIIVMMQNTSEDTIFTQKVSSEGGHRLRKNANYHIDM